VGGYSINRKIFLIGQNQQQVSNLILVADQLVEEGFQKTDLTFLSLDNVHCQNTNKALKDLNYNLIELPFKLTKPFYLNSYFQRLVSIFKSIEFFKQIICKDSILILGCDGAFERVAISLVENPQNDVFLIVDGVLSNTKFDFLEVMQNSEEKIKDIAKVLIGKIKNTLTLISKRLNIDYFAFSTVGQSKSGQVYVVGQSTKDVLVHQGVNPNKVLVTGVPRFDIQNLVPATSNVKKILYLSSAFAWHNFHEYDLAQKNDICQLTEFFANSEYEFNIKIHPREQEIDYEWLVGKYDNINVINGDLKEKIESHDLIISPFSTGLLESIALGKLAISYTKAFKEYKIKKLFINLKGFIHITSLTQLQEILSKITVDESFYECLYQQELDAFRYVFYKGNTTASEIIAKNIVSKLKK
jgi:hypothetical protein